MSNQLFPHVPAARQKSSFISRFLPNLRGLRVYAMFSDRNMLARPGLLPLGHSTLGLFYISGPKTRMLDLLPVQKWRQSR